MQSQHPQNPRKGHDPLEAELARPLDGESSAKRQEQEHGQKCGGDNGISTGLPTTLEQALADGWQIVNDKYSPLANELSCSSYWYRRLQNGAVELVGELVLCKLEPRDGPALYFPIRLCAEVTGPAFQRDPVDEEVNRVIAMAESSDRLRAALQRMGLPWPRE